MKTLQTFTEKQKNYHRRDLALSAEMLFLVWNPVSSFSGSSISGKSGIVPVTGVCNYFPVCYACGSYPISGGNWFHGVVFTTLFAGIVGTGMAGSASLLYRFGTFVFPFLVGTVVVLIRHFGRKKISGNGI